MGLDEKPTFIMVKWGRQIGSSLNNCLDQAEGFTNTPCERKIGKDLNKIEFMYLKSFPSSNEYRIWWKVGRKYKNGCGKAAERKNNGQWVIVMDTNLQQKH